MVFDFPFLICGMCQLGTKVFNILEDNCLVKKECFEVSYKFTRKKSTLTEFWISLAFEDKYGSFNKIVM